MLRFPWRRSSRCALLPALLAPAALAAQPAAVTIPPGIILPNYERVPIGQREGLEGGAFVARTDDAVANGYNPAGLVKSEASALNASATTYEWMNITLEGLEQSAARSRLPGRPCLALPPRRSGRAGLAGMPCARRSSFGFIGGVPNLSC